MDTTIIGLMGIGALALIMAPVAFVAANWLDGLADGRSGWRAAACRAASFSILATMVVMGFSLFLFGAVCALMS